MAHRDGVKSEVKGQMRADHLSSFSNFLVKKNAYALKAPHVAVFITVILASRFFGNSIHEIIDDLQETFH